MATTKTIQATLSGYKNVKGGAAKNLSATASGTSDYKNLQNVALKEAQSAAATAVRNAISPASNRAELGSWYTTGGTTDSDTETRIGNLYDESKSDVTITSYGTPVYSVNAAGTSYKCQISATGYCSCKSTKTARDTVASFAVSPSLIDTASLTISHAEAGDEFPAYLAVGSDVNTFLSGVTNVTYQAITLSGTSTTIALSESLLTTLKNLDTESVVINIGKYYPNGQVKSSYAGALTLTGVTMSYTASAVELFYSANGGTGAPATDYNAQPDSPYVLSTTVPTRTGYTFLGWSKNSGATEASYSAGGTITLTGDTILYAVWQAKTYTITYNANGGTGSTTATVTYGSGWTTHNGDGFSKSGYGIVGWATSADGATAYELGKTQSSWSTTANVTFYAVWAIKTYTITYQSDSNSYAGTSTTATKTHGTALTLKGETFYRHGYTQTGWSTSAGGTKAYNVGGSYTTDANATFYPFWTENTNHTVTLNANGGTLPNGATTKSFQLAEGAFYGNNLETPTKGSEVFTGWHTESGQRVNSESIFTATANQTLTAQWGIVPVVIIQKRGSVTKFIKDKSGKALVKGIETS